MAFFWERQGMRKFRAVAVVVRMGMDICFGNVFSPTLQVRELLSEFMPLMARDRSNWP